jgi:hypothetical protein
MHNSGEIAPRECDCCYSLVIARLAAFAKASAAERICGPGEALAETGPGDPVFQRRL